MKNLILSEIKEIKKMMGIVTEQYTEEDIPMLVNRFSKETPKKDDRFDDEFDRADYIISLVVDKITDEWDVEMDSYDDDYDDLYYRIKTTYGQKLTGFDKNGDMDFTTGGFSI
tara:strand:+ start:1501 stop:1839 length:339 start_codon:yes stop_codon:yes gene_type:complete